MSQKSKVWFLSPSSILSMRWIIIDHQKWPRHAQTHFMAVTSILPSTWLLCLAKWPACINSPIGKLHPWKLYLWVSKQSRARTPGDIGTSLNEVGSFRCPDVWVYMFFSQWKATSSSMKSICNLPHHTVDCSWPPEITPEDSTIL